MRISFLIFIGLLLQISTAFSIVEEDNTTKKKKKKKNEKIEFIYSKHLPDTNSNYIASNSDKKNNRIAVFVKGNLSSFIESEIRKSIDPHQKRAKGKVIISFQVNEKGIVDDVRIYRGLQPELDIAAAEAVLATSGKWLPAIRDGKPCSIFMMCPITF